MCKDIRLLTLVWGFCASLWKTDSSSVSASQTVHFMHVKAKLPLAKVQKSPGNVIATLPTAT